MAEGEDVYGLTPLRRFYRVHAGIYDWTRPFILFGRETLLRGLGVERGHLALDVGCGTGLSFPHLARAGAAVVGIEASPDMLSRARLRAERSAGASIRLDGRPYGSHEDYAGSADRILFSYSLSMIPPFEDVLSLARRDLKPGGRIGVVDFLDALDPFPARALAASHVHLGRGRLDALRRLFPVHELRVRRTGLWRYFLFWGRGPESR